MEAVGEGVLLGTDNVGCNGWQSEVTVKYLMKSEL